MFKLINLTVAVILLYVQTVVATGQDSTNVIRERCKACKHFVSLQNRVLNEVKAYDGFQKFLTKYDTIQQYRVTDPELICLSSDMCSFYEKPQSDSNTFEELSYDNDLAIQADQYEVFFKLTNPVCRACKKVFLWVMHQVEHLASKRPKKGVVSDFFAKGCRYLPMLLRKSCRVLIKHKSKKLAKMVLEKYAPKLACKLAKACF